MTPAFNQLTEEIIPLIFHPWLEEMETYIMLCCLYAVAHRGTAAW